MAAVSPHLGQPPADGDDRAQDEFAGTAGGTAASGADRALTAGSPERGEGDDGGPAEPGRDTNQAGQGASSSRPAAGGADRIWHSPAAGLPTPAPSGPAPAPGGPAPAPGAGANRPREGGTAAAPSKPATGGTYRVLTGKIVGLSRPATDGAERTGDGGTAAPSNSDPGSSERLGHTTPQPCAGLRVPAARRGRRAATSGPCPGPGPAVRSGRATATSPARPARGPAARTAGRKATR